MLILRNILAFVATAPNVDLDEPIVLRNALSGQVRRITGLDDEKGKAILLFDNDTTIVT